MTQPTIGTIGKMAPGCRDKGLESRSKHGHFGTPWKLNVDSKNDEKWRLGSDYFPFQLGDL